MKTKTYLFRIVVGSIAFLFSLGIFSTWRYLRTAPPAADEVDWAKINGTYPMMPAETNAGTAPEPEKNEAETKFDAEGYYYISGDQPPKGFEDFENFNITNKDYKTENEEDYGKLIAPQGYVQTKNEIKFSKISIGGEQIQFETERVKGISYTFSDILPKRATSFISNPKPSKKFSKAN